MNDYQSHLLESIATLQDMRVQLFDRVINVGMHGVHQDINDVFEPGDSYMFELEHFDDTNDPNLQGLVDLIKQIDGTMQNLILHNDVSQEDIDIQ